MLRKSKFYKNAKEEIDDAFKRVPELGETKNFATEEIEEIEGELMDRFFDSIWELLNPDTTQEVELPLLVSRDPVSFRIMASILFHTRNQYESITLVCSNCSKKWDLLINMCNNLPH